jgi:hypothetical protein
MYGRYLVDPFPALLEDRIATSVVNLAVENAGIDAYLNDPGVLSAAANARLVVVQLSCSQNTSNRYYSVHPRRNDRFLKASPVLQSLYPEMDFTEVHFTRHLLARLRGICPDRFKEIAEEVRTAWLWRMRRLVGQLKGDVVLVWFAPVPLADIRFSAPSGDIFLDRPTIEALRPHVRRIVELVLRDWNGDRSEMHIPELESARAVHLPGPRAHRHAAEAIALAVRPLLK